MVKKRELSLCAIIVATVSYTHLDVYKRQYLYSLKLHAQFPMALLFRPELQIPPADFPAPEMHILLS